MTKVHIGCIDGSILTVTQTATEVRLRIGDTKARLSREAADRLANLLNQQASPVEDSEPLDAAGPEPESPTADVGVSDLIAAGYLAVGEVLTMIHSGVEFQATLTPDGYFDVDGSIRTSPSGAGRQITGRATNGWITWKNASGGSLDALRWQLRADRFQCPGFSKATIDSMRQVISRWVDRTLSKGTHPGRFDAEAVESFLAGNRYTESTLTSYRRYLDRWFAQYDSHRPSNS